jgi:hypothetical protein
LRLRGFAAAALVLFAGFATPAFGQTSCTAAERFTLNWNSQTAGSQGTGSRIYSATDSAARIENVTTSYSGATGSFTNLPIGAGGANVATPYNGAYFTGGVGAGQNALNLGVDFAGYTTDINSNTNVVAVRFQFASPVRELTFIVFDVDFGSGQYRDWLKITGVAPGGATVTPRIASPYPTATPRNNQTNPGNTAPSTSAIGATATPATITNQEVLGITGASGQNDDFGNLIVTFQSPITEFTLRYGNGPATTMAGTAGLQGIGIHRLNFCTMPKISMTKVSSVFSDPINGQTNPKAIPGADIDYVLTIFNQGGSAVDLNTQAITDALPNNFDFFNGDIDTGIAGTQNVVITPGTSGLTLAAANVTYSSTGTAPYTYTPAAGYDALMRGLRIAPQGSMAANSSFTLRFRGRVRP